jgi:hypothetical protein
LVARWAATSRLRICATVVRSSRLQAGPVIGKKASASTSTSPRKQQPDAAGRGAAGTQDATAYRTLPTRTRYFHSVARSISGGGRRQ